MKPTQEQIDEQMNLAAEGVDQGSKYPGMSYEEGVQQALGWVQGHFAEPPMSDDE